jgi:hypothetical protein
VLRDKEVVGVFVRFRAPLHQPRLKHLLIILIKPTLENKHPNKLGRLFNQRLGS